MPITHPDYVEDFKLTFENKSFSISKCLFGLYSNFFKRHPSFIQNSLDLTEHGISINSFEQFVKACQGHFYSINNDNCFDLLTLCNKLEVQVIKKEVKRFILNIDDNLLIINRLAGVLKSSIPYNEDDINLIDEIENTIAKRINLYLVHKSFVELPISNLFNIISKSISYSKAVTKSTVNKAENNQSEFSDLPMSIDSHLFFEFLLSALQIHKESSIALFDLIEDYGQFTQREINALIEKSPISTDIMDSILSTGLSPLTEKTNQQMTQIDDLRSKIKSIQDKSTIHVNKVEKKVNDLKTDFETIKSKSLQNLMSSPSANIPFSLSFKIPSYFSKVTIYESKNDKEITVNLNSSNAINFLDEINDQFDELQNLVNKNNNTINDFKKRYESVVSLYNDMNSQFDSALNKLSSSELHTTNSSEKREENESAPLTKKSSSNLSIKYQKKQNTKAQSVLQKRSTKKANINNNNNNTSSPSFWDNLFEYTKEITCDYIENSNNDNNNNNNNNNDIDSNVCNHHSSSEPFNGILCFLSKRISETSNLFDSSIVDIKASSTSIKYPSLICDSKSNYYWSSDNTVNQWVKIDFKSMMIKITHYSIQTISRTDSHSHLKNWVLEGTNAEGFSPNDVQKDIPAIIWESIDNRENDQNLNGLNKICTYEAPLSKKFFRYIRLKITGPNHSGNYSLALRRIEFFGTIRPIVNKDDEKTQKNSDKSKSKS